MKVTESSSLYDNLEKMSVLDFLQMDVQSFDPSLWDQLNLYITLLK